MSASPVMRNDSDVMRTPHVQSRSDELTGRLHITAAVAYIGALPLTTAPHNIAFGVLALFSAIRWRETAEALRFLWRRPVVLALCLWFVVTALSLLWTNNIVEGLEELKAFRVIALPLLLLPLRRHTLVLSASFLIGVALQNMIQCAQYFDLLGFEAVKNNRAPGLLHVTQTATMCLAAACFHLAIIARGRGLARWLSVPALGLACLGLILTGSRGPWLAGALIMPIETIALILLSARSRLSIVIACAALVATGAIATPFIKPFVTQRIDAAVSQFEAARHGDYRSDVGLKYANWMWASRFFRESPIIGIGAGSFRETVMQTPEYEQLVEAHPHRSKGFARAHPHSTWLQVLTCTGLLGLAPFLAFVIAFLLMSWRRLHGDSISIGVRYALLAWLIGAQFDTYHGNGHQFGLLMLLLSLLLMHASITVREFPSAHRRAAAKSVPA